MNKLPSRFRLTLPLENSYSIRVEFILYPGSPGSHSGPPDFWYPPEPQEIEIDLDSVVILSDRLTEPTRNLESWLASQAEEVLSSITGPDQSDFPPELEELPHVR